MREIKFRAWHLGYDREGHTTYIPPEMIFDSNPGDCLRWLSAGQNIRSVMQYTGLKDKTGVEVYEGDIVQDEWEKKVVSFTRQSGYSPFEYCGGGEMDSESCVVIGNVHQNPELLEAS